MKIGLLGEASNLHWTLAEGLRAMGHDVTVASAGSGFMANSRDIDLTRKGYDMRGSVRYLFDLLHHLPTFRRYDVVQLSNPVFLHLRPEKIHLVFDYLKRHNAKIFLDALGTDFYYVNACQKGAFRYSDFYLDGQLRTYPGCQETVKAWCSDPLKSLNRYIAEHCNGIAACLYEYYIGYRDEFSEKLAYLPIPIHLPENITPDNRWGENIPVRFFLGIQRERSALKGTDVFDEVLQAIQKKYPEECEIKRVVSIPLSAYLETMRSSHILLDQLYSYTPATNALQAMSQGLCAVSGAEPEYYTFIGEDQLRPIFNAIPDAQQLYTLVEKIIKGKRELPRRCADSRTFVEKHHNYIDVARQYIDFWERH